jgi:hypothetical protein
MSKTMSQAIRGQNLKVRIVTLALAVLLLVLTLVVGVVSTTTTSDSGSAKPANHAMSGKGGVSFTDDLYGPNHDPYGPPR